MRIARGLTQAELAAPHYTHSFVSSIEAGRRRPSREALAHFAAKLSIEPEELEAGRRPGFAADLALRLQEAVIGLSAGRLEESAAAIRSVARKAGRARLATIQARAEEAYGLYLERLEEPEAALEHYRLAEDILASEAPTARVDAVAGQARCYHSLGDTRYEIHILEVLLGDVTRQGLLDPNALARLHAALAYAYVEAGLYAKAAESAAELQLLAPQVSDPLRVAQMNVHVARVYLMQGKVRQAEEALRRSEECYRQVNLRTETGYAHLALGYVYTREGRLEEARGEIEQAVDVFGETGDTKDLTRTLNELARIERLQGRADRARNVLERSISLMGESDAPILAWAHRELGTVLAGSDVAEAEKHLRRAIEIYERNEHRVDIAVTSRILGDVLRAGGDHDGGCETYRAGILALEPLL